jgi:hypothetical protein
MRGHYYRLYTQQFRHQLEVQFGLADANAEDLTADAGLSTEVVSTALD